MGDCPHQPCRCAQHVRGIRSDSAQGVAPGQPLMGAVTFSLSGPGSGWEVPPDAYTDMAEHVRRAVDDYVAGLPEVEDDAATVVELVRRGDSWHISIRAGKMYHETAEDSLGAAFDAIGRVLGEKVARRSECVLQIDPQWAASAVSRAAERIARSLGAELSDFDHGWQQGHDNASAELLAALPPCQITDPEALAKLTPSKVRAYLKGKGWQPMDLPSCVAWKAVGASCVLNVDRFRFEHVAVILEALADLESRSAAAVYLDILQTEPGG